MACYEYQVQEAEIEELAQDADAEVSFTIQFLPFYICPKPEYLSEPLIINK